MRLCALAVVVTLCLAAPAAAAPGAPGAVANWTAGDKVGFGTARDLGSKVWFTLQGGELSEVYAPDLGTPSLRDLQFVVTDGVEFESLTGRPYKLYVLADPALSNTGDDDRGDGLVAYDATNASALAASPALRAGSSGYMGASDGWTDLRDDHRLDWSYDATEPGNVVQVAETALTGTGRARHMTLALGFASSADAAARTTASALRGGFERAARRYATGWHEYLDGLRRPRAASGIVPLYDASLMVMAATEDKTHRGALIAAPSMPWVWGNIAGYSGPYHLVWSRDAYQVATALLAAGDRGAASRSVDYLWGAQQKPDGCFPQNSNLDGSPHWPNLQLDDVADPIVLSWQLRRFDAGTYAHVARAAECIVREGPTSQERWENAEGYSPATIAAAIAGLVCAADIATRNGDAASAQSWLRVADEWQRSVDGWTLTRTGPLSADPYYLRLTVDGKPDEGTTYTIGDGGPTIDQRAVVDTSFLELVRLGVKAPDDAGILSSLPVVDRELGVDTPNGRFWHRYNHDGYGETLAGGPFPGDGNSGRLWPIFAGERGEYELAAGDLGAARGRLRSIAATANSGRLLPEQVWDDKAPPGQAPGTGTFSATPLGWTHAQLVRLAWSIDAGRPVEQPAIVACRYAYADACRENSSE
jgi:glucoamylase